MVQIPAKALTISEFLDLPETEPASEYIDGRIIQKPMPQGEHRFNLQLQVTDVHLPRLSYDQKNQALHNCGMILQVIKSPPLLPKHPLPPLPA